MSQVFRAREICFSEMVYCTCISLVAQNICQEFFIRVFSFYFHSDIRLRA